MPEITFDEFVRIGFIQTNLDNDVAWGPESNITLNMKKEAENYVWQEIKKGFHKLSNHHIQPNLIIMPELTIPNGRIKELLRLANKINSVIIAGKDYSLEKNEISNKAVLIVPNNWGTRLKSTKSTYYYLGKKYLANVERKTISNFNSSHLPHYTFVPDQKLYLIESGVFGRMGFAICADFYDMERFVAYKGRVQHIIIIAYNKDINSFFALSEAIARLVMCNVIICNTGKFGDSMVFCPYKEDYKRQIFRHQGANLFATQVVEIPVLSLILDQLRAAKNIETKNFKSPPEFGYFGETMISDKSLHKIAIR